MHPRDKSLLLIGGAIFCGAIFSTLAIAVFSGESRILFPTALVLTFVGSVLWVTRMRLQNRVSSSTRHFAIAVASFLGAFVAWVLIRQGGL